MRRTFGLILFLVLLCAPAAVLGATSEELRMEQEYSKAKLLILSADINDNARRKAENVSNGRRVLVQPIHYTRAELASAFGMADCSMAAVTDIGFANALAKILAAKDAERYGALSAELEKRNEKAVRRKREKPQRADSKRNGKRRTEV